MSRAESLARLGGQDARLLPLVTIVPYGLLAALVVVTVVVRRGAGGALLVDLCLCAAVAVWMLWMFTLHPAWWERPGVMGLFFAGLVVLNGVLVVRDPWFGIFTPACYAYAFGLLPWPWRLPGVAAVALEAGSAQASAVPKDSAVGAIAFGAVLAVNVVGMCGAAWWEWDVERKNEERQTALEQVREANRRLQETLAGNAALHRRLVVQAREAGVLDERQRMAREIHDTLAQGLIGIVTQLQAAEQAAEQAGDHVGGGGGAVSAGGPGGPGGPGSAGGPGGVPDRWRAHLAAATRLARESLAEARRSVDALRPQPLETAGLGEALAGVAERWSALHGVAVRVTTTGTARPMPPEAELALLRAAQEALANVARHAGAATVALTLGYLEDEVTLDVCDDGRGFGSAPAAPAPTAGAAGGFGLEAMRERIEGVSGTLRVRSELGAGTTVSARVPHGIAGVGA